MKTRQKIVYYCDYCKKHTLTQPSMIRHEKHCTNNPNRECRLCGRTSERSKEMLEKFKSIDNYQDFLNLTEGCPNCMLLCIRYYYKHFFNPTLDFNKEPNEYEVKLLNFKYKNVLKEWWEE